MDSQLNEYLRDAGDLEAYDLVDQAMQSAIVVLNQGLREECIAKLKEIHQSPFTHHYHQALALNLQAGLVKNQRQARNLNRAAQHLMVSMAEGERTRESVHSKDALVRDLRPRIKEVKEAIEERWVEGDARGGGMVGIPREALVLSSDWPYEAADSGDDEDGE